MKSESIFTIGYRVSYSISCRSNSDYSSLMLPDFRITYQEDSSNRKDSILWRALLDSFRRQHMKITSRL